ncbi:MAG: conjugal transfer protein TraI [Robiginitomaculum sp.]|nr:MAG: conjugal transfer protein TraI [Robiginitomaculum sp.]
MSSDDFEVYLGIIRSPNGARKATGFLKKLGKNMRSRPMRGGRRASPRFRHIVAQNFQRRVMVKMHIVRMDGAGIAAQKLHINYIQRDSAAREGDLGHVYDETQDKAGDKAFVERGREDRHQFRIIVSPEDAIEMVDLKPFVRDLMSQMETDLGTKLDWVAANHYNTDNPHTHIVIGGKQLDGTDLVIPKRYCFEGLRIRAQELVTLELGPVTQLEARRKQAMGVKQERLTQIDRDMLKSIEDNIVDHTEPYKTGQGWKRQLERARLKTLVNLNLANQIGREQWKLADSIEDTLRRMGERGDIIKTMHRAMAETGLKRHVDANSIYSRHNETAKPVTGKVIAKGIADDVQDKAYIVVENLNGKTVYIDVGKSDAIDGIAKGMVVTASIPEAKVKKSDKTLAEIAKAHGGIYSPSLHMETDPKARVEFVEAHVRRLEALRRGGVVVRKADGSWQLPNDYLKQVVAFEQNKMRSAPVSLVVNSREPISSLTNVVGATWLDETLRDVEDNLQARGFGQDVQAARSARRMFLREQGILGKNMNALNQKHLEELACRDFQDAARSIEKTLGKKFVAVGRSGRIDGTFTRSIDRPSGKFAVIERSKEFSLVPWRDVLERSRGKMVSGIMRGGNVSWTLNRGRGVS